ncbi:hypothetical protein PybrP1_002329 [[Pythium] brassicae (nom. inval.)]|nr:hypothetical protein PybrP1_002329 [[Pythium] brassicae (nom. inval.)]
MSDDLYGDLDTSTSALRRKEAADLQRKAEQEADALRVELAALQNANRELGRANQVLTTNLSQVFATAQNELQRKDKEIRRLREALEAHTSAGGARSAHGSSRADSRESHKSPTLTSQGRVSSSERHR